MQKTNCYMTFTDEKYLPCVIRQAQRIKYLKSKYEYIVMIDQNDLFSQNKLKENNIHYICINQQLFSNLSSGRFQKTLSKFKIIDFLNQYEKICWLDADTILITNIDYLFDECKNNQFLGFLNTEIDKIEGIIFIITNQLNKDRFKKYLYQAQYFKKDDEEILNNYFLRQIDIVIKDKDLSLIHFAGFLKLFNYQNNFKLIQNIFYNYSDIEFNNFIDKNYFELYEVSRCWIEFVNYLEKIPII